MHIRRESFSLPLIATYGIIGKKKDDFQAGNFWHDCCTNVCFMAQKIRVIKIYLQMEDILCQQTKNPFKQSPWALLD